MGQQQLLLIVLGVVIVGIAVVAGFGMFNSGAEEATKDELIVQCMNIAANAQQFYRKPGAMGGGGGEFSDYTIPARMRATSNAGAMGVDGLPTANGYVITAQAADELTITATPNSDEYGWTVVCVVDPVNIQTTVTENE